MKRMLFTGSVLALLEGCVSVPMPPLDLSIAEPRIAVVPPLPAANKIMNCVSELWGRYYGDNESLLLEVARMRNLLPLSAAGLAPAK